MFSEQKDYDYQFSFTCSDIHKAVQTISFTEKKSRQARWEMRHNVNSIFLVKDQKLRVKYIKNTTDGLPAQLMRS